MLMTVQIPDGPKHRSNTRASVRASSALKVSSRIMMGDREYIARASVCDCDGQSGENDGKGAMNPTRRCCWPPLSVAPRLPITVASPASIFAMS